MKKKLNKNQSELLFCFSPRHFPVELKDKKCPICAFCDEMIRLANGKDNRQEHRQYKGIVNG